MFGDCRNPLKVVVASVAEMCGSKAEENSYGAAITTFVL